MNKTLESAVSTGQPSAKIDMVIATNTALFEYLIDQLHSAINYRYQVTYTMIKQLAKSCTIGGTPASTWKEPIHPYSTL